MAKEEKDVSLDLTKMGELSVTKNDDGKALGIENYEPSTTFGYLKIDHKSGELEYTLTGEKRKSWKIVMTGFSFSRIMFEKGFGNPEPLCKTTSREQNKLNLEGTTYGKCFQCEYSKWSDGKRPPCDEQLNINVLVEGNLVTPGSITCKGASAMIGRQLLDKFAKENINPWSVIMEVSTTGPFTSGNVDYYKLKFSEVGKVDPELADTLTATYIESGGIAIFGKDGEISDEVSADEAEAILTKEDDVPFK